MKQINVTNEMLLRARQRAKELGQLRNSITRGNGNLVGFIGEEVAAKVLNKAGYKVCHDNTYDYDLIANDHTIDVKTKSTSVEPLPHYDCSVAAFNTKQDCNYYAFVRVKNDLTVAWWCGVMSKDDYYKESVFLKKGEVKDDNSFVVKADCYNLPISKLKEMP